MGQEKNDAKRGFQKKRKASVYEGDDHNAIRPKKSKQAVYQVLVSRGPMSYDTAVLAYCTSSSVHMRAVSQGAEPWSPTILVCRIILL